MKWLVGLLSLWVSQGRGALRAASQEPALVIVCERGGVQKDISHIASGSQCVLHDASGTSTSVGALSVYDDTEAVP